ncbi:MAG: ribonuclease III [Candidatus Hydrogenedentota bacterium]|nr:MAG: ribonuclease III [Candidatus Hydrogenedentota bacterium]
MPAFFISMLYTKQEKKKIQEWAKKNNLDHVQINLLIQALTHKSKANELALHTQQGKHFHNERLEFLGDAILGSVIAAALYQQNPNIDEGKLTRLKAHLIREQTLAKLGKQLGLSKVLRLGKGEAKIGGATRDSNLANAVEAIIGALYLSQGFEKTRKWILALWQKDLEQAEESIRDFDYKSRLQEILMRKRKVLPKYKVQETIGPEHDKTFVVGLFIQGKKVSEGIGKSRQKAEEEAAKKYLDTVSRRNAEKQ